MASNNEYVRKKFYTKSIDVLQSSPGHLNSSYSSRGVYDDHLVLWAEDEDGNDSCIHFHGYVEVVSFYVPYEHHTGGKKLLDQERSLVAIKNAIHDYVTDESQFSPGSGNKLIDFPDGKKVRLTYGVTTGGYQSLPKIFANFQVNHNNMKAYLKKVATSGRIRLPCLDVDRDCLTKESWRFIAVDEEAHLPHKFVVEKQIDYAGWITCEVVKTGINYSTAIDYHGKHETVLKDTGSGMGKNNVVLAYDIECYSESYKLPDKNKISDYIGMISLVYGQFGSKEFTSEVITIFPINEIKDCTAIVVKSERELLRVFLKRIKEIDPLWITGYNIDGFDTPYIAARCRHYKIPLMCSKIHGAVARTIALKESMNGRFQNGLYLDAHGRFSKDLLKLMKTKFRWRSYKLDFAAKEIFGKNDDDNKMDLGSYKEIFYAMEDYDPNVPETIAKATEIADYNKQDSVVCFKFFNKLAVHYDDLAMANAANVTVTILNTRGQMVRTKNAIYRTCKGIIQPIIPSWEAKKDIPDKDKKRHPMYFYMLPTGGSDETYKGGDVSKPIVGLHKKVFTLDFASLYPSIIIAYNICYTTLITPGMCAIMDDRKAKGLFRKGDFTWEPYDEKTNREGNWRRVMCEEDGVVVEYRFVHESKLPGILPMICKNLIVKRKAEKAIMSACVYGSMDYILADVRQLAIKVVNNSTYGFLKSPGQWAFLPGAKSTTYIGRTSKIYVEQLLIEQGCTIVYGDTDSAMAKPNKEMSLQEGYVFAKQMEEYVNGKIPQGLTMEMEKVGLILSINAKMYIYWDYDIKTQDYKMKGGKPDFLIRGVASTKRDRALSHIHLYERIYTDVMYNARGVGIDPNVDFPKFVLNYVWQACKDTYFGAQGQYSIENGKRTAIVDEKGNPIKVVDANGEILTESPYTWEDMELTYKMGSDYSAESYHLNVLSKRLEAIGRAVPVGDRFGAIIIKKETSSIGSKMYTSDEYKEHLREWDRFEKGIPDPQTGVVQEPARIEIDRMHYVEKKMAATTDLLIERSFVEEIEYVRKARSIRRINNVFKKLYMEHGCAIFNFIAGKPDAMEAIVTCKNRRIAEQAKNLFKSDVINAKRPIYTISDQVVGNFCKHIRLRSSVLADIRAKRK